MRKETNSESIGRQIGGSLKAGVIFTLLFLGPWLLKDINPKTVPFTAIVWGGLGIIVAIKMAARK